MPYYEYHCLDCQKDLEIFQKITERAKRKCPECGGKLKKLISASAFHLKGSGWYQTDYADKGKKKESTSDATSSTSTSTSTSASTSESKSDSKSNSKPESKKKKKKEK